MIKRRLSPDEALVRLEVLCARSEQCSSEVMQKLFRWGVEPGARQGILDSLIDRRFVDDARYASAYARSKFLFSRWGRKKIRLGLLSKRIDRAIIDRAVEEATAEGYETTLQSLMLSRLRQCPAPLSREDALKLCRFAMQRGFEWEYVSKVLDDLRHVDYDKEDS